MAPPACPEIASVDKSRLAASLLVAETRRRRGKTHCRTARCHLRPLPSAIYLCLRLSNDSIVAERREPPGRARLRVGCCIGQFELGRWFGRSACALPLIRGTSCSKAIVAASYNEGCNFLLRSGLVSRNSLIKRGLQWPDLVAVLVNPGMNLPEPFGSLTAHWTSESGTPSTFEAIRSSTAGSSITPE